jgi:hypothetical protein
VSSVEDRNGGEAEKSIKSRTCPEPGRGISRLAYGSLEMTPTRLGEGASGYGWLRPDESRSGTSQGTVFYRAIRVSSRKITDVPQFLPILTIAHIYTIAFFLRAVNIGKLGYISFFVMFELLFKCLNSQNYTQVFNFFTFNPHIPSIL